MTRAYHSVPTHEASVDKGVGAGIQVSPGQKSRHDRLTPGLLQDHGFLSLLGSTHRYRQEQKHDDAEKSADLLRSKEATGQ
jgi:hypothetical protein